MAQSRPLRRDVTSGEDLSYSSLFPNPGDSVEGVTRGKVEHVRAFTNYYVIVTYARAIENAL